MKKLLITMVVALTAMVASAQVNFESSSTLRTLIERAASEEKLIFVDCYAEWCGPCKYMDANVFTDKSVGEFMNENFINAKFDMEKGDGLAIGRRYLVKSYPTFLILNKKGEEVARLIGSSGPSEFIERIQEKLKEQ